MEWNIGGSIKTAPRGHRSSRSAETTPIRRGRWPGGGAHWHRPWPLPTCLPSSYTTFSTQNRISATYLKYKKQNAGRRRYARKNDSITGKPFAIRNENVDTTASQAVTTTDCKDVWKCGTKMSDNVTDRRRRRCGSGDCGWRGGGAAARAGRGAPACRGGRAARGAAGAAAADARPPPRPAPPAPRPPSARTSAPSPPPPHAGRHSARPPRPEQERHFTPRYTRPVTRVPHARSDPSRGRH